MRLISSGTLVHLIKCNIHSPSNIANVHVDVLTIVALFLLYVLFSSRLFSFGDSKVASWQILTVPIILTEAHFTPREEGDVPGMVEVSSRVV